MTIHPKTSNFFQNSSPFSPNKKRKKKNSPNVHAHHLANRSVRNIQTIQLYQPHLNIHQKYWQQQQQQQQQLWQPQLEFDRGQNLYVPMVLHRCLQKLQVVLYYEYQVLFLSVLYRRWIQFRFELPAVVVVVVLDVVVVDV